VFQLTERPEIIKCLETGAFFHTLSDTWIGQAYRDWLEAGNTPQPCPPPYELYSKEHFQAIRAAAWEWMTVEVRARRYDNIETCCSYYNSGVERYRLEARAMVAWRDAVNLRLEQLVLAPPAGIETWDQVCPLLPQPAQFNWPSSVELPLGVGDGPAIRL